jgi:hypothetical protein
MYDAVWMMCSLTIFEITRSQAYEGVSHISCDCPTLLSHMNLEDRGYRGAAGRVNIAKIKGKGQEG